MHAEARKAERAALFDPRTPPASTPAAPSSSRWLYQANSLPTPYKDDLSARLHDPAFISVIGHGLQAKMNLVRKFGNTAVHEARPIAPDAGRKALAEIFHVLSWLARTYATQETSKPSPQQQLDPALLSKPGGGAVVAKSVAQLKKLQEDAAAKDAKLAESEAQRADLAAQLAARDSEVAALLERSATQDELIAELKALIAAAQASNAAAPDTDLESLEELLGRSGAGAAEDLERAVANAQGLARFVRSLVGLDRQAVSEAFAEFLHGRTATASQIDFVDLIITHLTRCGEMDPALLFEAPFTDAAPEGPTQLFGQDQTVRLVTVLRDSTASSTRKAPD